MNNLFLEEEIKLKEEAVRVFCNISKVITYSFEEKEIRMQAKKWGEGGRIDCTLGWERH